MNCFVDSFDVGLPFVLNRKFLIFLLFGVLIGIIGGQWYNSVFTEKNQSHPKDSIPTVQSAETKISDTTQEEIPDYVVEVLHYIRTNHEAKEGYVGGKRFMNFEGKLPKKTSVNVKINYQEWDVHPKEKGKNRGSERLVTGDDESAWYTKDHYVSFIKIN